MHSRQATLIVDAQARPTPPGFSVHAINAEGCGGSLDPFLSVDVFRMSRPIFPPHPHAGFSALTYLLPESETGFRNRDSLGHDLTIAPGSLHWTMAGTGVLHEEVPIEAGRTALGLQIFVNLASQKKRSKPCILHLDASQVPMLSKAGATIRCVLGESNGMVSPLEPPTSVSLIDVALEPGATFVQTLACEENAFMFVQRGELDIAGAKAGAGQVVRTDPGSDSVEVTAGKGGARLFLFAGRPLDEPAVFHGPFVATTSEGARQMVADFHAGRMGVLEPAEAAV